MRDLFIILVIIGAIPFALRRPQVGVLIWFWISIANPHREAFGFSFDYPLLDIVAVYTLIGIAVNWQKLPKADFHPLMVMLGVYFTWITLTTVFAVEPELASEKWLRIAKTFLLLMAILVSMNKRHWILALVWVFVLSLAFTGVKGGLFTIITGGSFRVWGPDNSLWGANNGVSFAMLMGAPLLLALRYSTTSKLLKWALLGCALLFIVALLGTQSRGGVVGLVAVLAAFSLRSQYKVPAAILGVIILVLGFVFMPQAWKDRMASITDYEQDASATNRIVQWKYAIDISTERPLFGSGFHAFFHPPYVHRYLFDDVSRAVHSIYFEVLGEHGYIGLTIFLIIGVTAVRKAHSLRDLKLEDNVNKPFQAIGYATQYSFIGYAANGLTVNIAILDLYYYLIAILVLCLGQLRHELKEKQVTVRGVQKLSAG